MTLRNAFEGVATDSNIKRLLQQLHFARDSADRLRVIIDQTLSVRVHDVAWGNNGGTPGYYASGAPMSMDSRETQRFIVRDAVIQNRNRWSVT